jgi:hypothetical protein
MRRRELLLLGGVMTAARGLQAQHKATPVIGWLGGSSPGPASPFVAAFQQGLDETGYVEGQNVTIEYRWAEGYYDLLPALAADLVGRKVDVIATAVVIVLLLRQKPRPRRSRSFPLSAVTRSGRASLPASPGRAATSPVSAFSSSS